MVGRAIWRKYSSHAIPASESKKLPACRLLPDGRALRLEAAEREGQENGADANQYFLGEGADGLVPGAAYERIGASAEFKDVRESLSRFG